MKYLVAYVSNPDATPYYNTTLFCDACGVRYYPNYDREITYVRTRLTLKNDLFHIYMYTQYVRELIALCTRNT